MDRINLEARLREDTSKHHVKALRREGYVPASLYGKDMTSVSLEIALHSLAKAMKTDAGIHAVIDLKVEGGTKEANGPAVVKEIQKDYLGRRIVHVAIQKISMKDKFIAPVVVTLHGEPVGVKLDAGILEQVLEVVEVKCLPGNLPPHFDVDVNEWGIGYVLHAKDLAMPDDVELSTDPEAVVASVRAPHVRKEAEAEVAVETAVSEAPAATTEESA